VNKIEKGKSVRTTNSSTLYQIMHGILQKSYVPKQCKQTHILHQF